MKFSQKYGYTQIRDALQIDSMDSPLRNALWNLTYENIFSYNSPLRVDFDRLGKAIWVDFFDQQIDQIPRIGGASIYINGIGDSIKKWFLESAIWYELYDLIEFIGNNSNQIFIDKANDVFIKYMSGYIFVGTSMTKITSQIEIDEIEKSMNQKGQFSVINEHLQKALQHLTNRKNPDFRNSIKESISAVESVAKIITSDNKATLGKALSTIEKKYEIHPAMKSAFSSIYGYTSDSNGIRHALSIEDKAVNFAEAKFMLVSCSAFINYLIDLSK